MKVNFFCKFYLNIFGYAYSQVISLAIQLLLVPVYLTIWGADLYSDWLVITGIPVMLSLLDFGVAQASANKATMASGANDWNCAARTIQNSFVFSFFVALLIFTFAYCSTYFLDYSLLFKTSILNKSSCSLILIYSCINLAIQLMGGPLDAWYRTVDATAMGAFILANRRAADFAIIIIVLLSNPDPIFLVKMQVIVQLIMYFICSIYVVKHSPFNGFNFYNSNLHELKTLLKPSIGYTFIPVSQVITLQGSIQLINQYGDSKIVVMFSMARTLMRLVLQVGMVVNNALKPELSRIIGAGELDKARFITKKITILTCALSFLFFVFLVFLGSDIIDFWSGNKVSITRAELFLIGLHALLNIFWFVPSALYIANNSHFNLAKIYMISSILSLFLWILLSNILTPILGGAFLLTIPEFVVLVYFISRLPCVATFLNKKQLDVHDKF